MTGTISHFRPRMLLVAMVLVAMTLLAARQALPSTIDPQPFDPVTGYRIGQLRDPVPDHLEGGEALDLDKLEALLATSRPLLIDVYDDRPGRLNQWSFGLLRKPADRMNIAGSITMAGFGDGALDETATRAFNSQLADVIGADKTRPVVFYCLVNCWTSWNAARRAISLGYLDVKWFRDGVETWSDAGLPMAPVVR